MRALALAALSLAGCAHVAAPESAPSLDELFAQAASQQSALLIEFRGAACDRCDAFDRGVAASPLVRARLERTLFARYDVSTAHGRDAALRVGWPATMLSFFILDGDRRIVAWHLGALDDLAFARVVEHAIDIGGSEEALDAAMAQAPRDPRLQLRAARWYRSHGRESLALELYQRVADNTDAFAVQRDDAAWELLCLRARRAGERHDPAALLEYAQAHPSSDHVSSALFALLVTDGVDLAAFDRLIRQLAETAQPDGLVELADFALAGHAYDAALALAQRAVQKLPDATRLATLAEVYHYRGELPMAESFARKAASMAPDDARVRDTLARIERARNESSPDVDRMRWYGIAVRRLLFGR